MANDNKIYLQNYKLELSLSIPSSHCGILQSTDGPIIVYSV